MNSTTELRRTASSRRSGGQAGLRVRPGARDVLVLAAWLGLAAGLLEVGTRISCRAINPTDRLYLMSRHFIWLTPLANLVVFLCLGSCLAALTWLWPRLGAWLSPRLLVAMAILPALLVVDLQIYPEAWMVLSLGIAAQLVPWLARQPGKLWRWLPWSLPSLLALVLILAGSIVVGDWLEQRREDARQLPPAGSPNVLFIVLDTVRADRLSLYGYHRATTPTLERLARRGIRFDAARATAPWTLASHAGFFSGRWPHELNVEWETPLTTNFPLLAEYLGSRGYATAGVVANTRYCSYETNLGRGFTHYDDYEPEKCGLLRTAAIVERVRKYAVILASWAFRHDAASTHHALELIATWSGYGYRRNAESVNRGFLSWLDHRVETGRPFFVFLNYFDAHTPYRLPDLATPRFTRRPETPAELQVVYDDWTAMDKSGLPPYYLKLARDSYDNCLAYLDEMLGRLFNDLERRGVLGETWVVIAGDHGEGLGEHDLYEHGESLYSTEIRVPLLVLPPAGNHARAVVGDTVSLRDLAATVVDVVGLAEGAPFPGHSLANLWAGDSSRGDRGAGHEVLSALHSPHRSDPSHGRSPARRGPLVSLAEGDLVYIYNEGDRTEELFNERDDPRELTNLASQSALRPVLERFRQQRTRLEGGSSTLARSD